MPVMRYWLFFAIVLIIAITLRWGGLITDAEPMEKIINCALVFLGILHLSLTVEAFNDDILQGILCFFVPLYSVYYLLTHTASLVLRAVGAAILLAFGYDLAIFLIRAACASYEFINRWIAGGGTLW